MFVHLNTHSHYSFLEGLPSPAELVQAATQAGMPALALTDTNGISGAVEFQDHCELAGIQAIFGMECWFTFPEPDQSLSEENKIIYAQQSQSSPPFDRLVLLVENASGWSNLCWLSSKLHNQAAGTITPLSLDDLASHHQGLVCLAGGTRTQIAYKLRSNHEEAARYRLFLLQQIFVKSLYVNLQIHHAQDVRRSSTLANLARRMNLPLVASHEVHYLDEKESELQRLITAIRLNQPISKIPELELPAPNASFLTAAEMARRFQAYPQALRNTLQIAERCNYQLPLGKTHFPIPTMPPGETADSLLRKKAFAGASERYRQLTPQIQGRLDHELTIIQQCGFAALFLIMEEIIRFTRQQGIPFSSRGSAASSLVAYCLGITTPDPLKLNLYFERFLNPARATPPDIDTDLCSKRRDEVLDFVMRHFGKEKVAMVGTINRFRERSALRECAKALGLPASRIKELTERLPYRWFGSDASPEAQPYDVLRQAFPDVDSQHLINQATLVLRKPRHLSIHPGGVVIAPGQMTDFVPTMLAPKGLLITQLDHFHIERLGLVKIDLLGIRGLSVLGDVAQSLKRKANLQENSPDQNEHAPRSQDPIPWPEFFSKKMHDAKVEEMLREGRTIGCFQIESPGMRATLREINASSLEDIMVALALYRPGPLTGGLKRSFVERYRAQQRGEVSQFEHLHPSLAPLLGDTYGVVLYQEQVLRIAHELAGFSLAEADLLRRAMSHFDPGKQMQTLKEKFILGAFQHQSVPAEIAERIWELMAAFAGYGFPKAHAASYAQIAWRAAWCKTHHPEIFMAAVLANWGGYYSQRVYLNEARRLGLILQAPHINYAQKEFSVQYKGNQAVLFMGLDQVRDLTHNTQKRLIAERPFHSLTDFLVRVDPRPQEIENLIRIGALEGFGEIPQLLAQVEKKDWKSGQFPLFSTAIENSQAWPLEKMIADQEAILGAAVIAHPLELAAERIKAAGAISTVEAIQCPGQNVRVAGMRQTWRRGKTTRGELYYFMSLEDLEGMLDVFIPGEVYRRYRHAFSMPGPWIIEGNLEPDPTSGECTLRATRVEVLERSHQG